MQAREETEEAIQSHNQRYNAMLHEHISKEEQLAGQIEQLKLSVADATRSLSEAQQQHHMAAAEATATLSRNCTAWEDERRALQRAHERVRRVAFTCTTQWATFRAANSECFTVFQSDSAQVAEFPAGCSGWFRPPWASGHCVLLAKMNALAGDADHTAGAVMQAVGDLQRKWEAAEKLAEGERQAAKGTRHEVGALEAQLALAARDLHTARAEAAAAQEELRAELSAASQRARHAAAQWDGERAALRGDVEAAQGRAAEVQRRLDAAQSAATGSAKQLEARLTAAEAAYRDVRAAADTAEARVAALQIETDGQAKRLLELTADNARLQVRNHVALRVFCAGP